MTDDLRAEMDKLATSLAKTAGDAATDIKDRIDAFKALTTYAVFRTKHPDGPDDDDDAFDFTKDIHGNGTIPDRRNA